VAKAKKYKLKTHKATAKRFKVTGSGKVMRTKGGKSHFRRRRSKRTKVLLSRMLSVNSTIAKRVRTLAPYLHLYKQNPPA
jgi:large subunit ribosomal protein L35